MFIPKLFELGILFMFSRRIDLSGRNVWKLMKKIDWWGLHDHNLWNYIVFIVPISFFGFLIYSVVDIWTIHQNNLSPFKAYKRPKTPNTKRKCLRNRLNKRDDFIFTVTSLETNLQY